MYILYKNHVTFSSNRPQKVDLENAYLCGYLKINNLTDDFPTMVTYFDGEIIGRRHPFLTRKWDANEEVDTKHWVSRLRGAQDEGRCEVAGGIVAKLAYRRGWGVFSALRPCRKLAVLV